jgi:hypothetical protein
MKQLSIFLFCLTASAALRPYGLECEARQNPVGVDALKPRLGWKLASDVKGDRQTAYQIEVTANGQVVWDSKRVNSPDSLWINYNGADLQPFTRYAWRVKVWDAKAKESDWSAPASWTMALTDPTQWRGAWITHPNHQLRSGPLPVFRKDVKVEKTIKNALILVAGLGFHELYVNGTKVGDHVLSPAWSNYRATVFYETFDVTSLLKPGANALGVMLGNGFYNVAGGRYVKYIGSFGDPRLALRLHVEYQDGTSADVATDRTWRVTEGPITFSCMYGGEDYDARRELGAWAQPGYDDSAWLTPNQVEAPGGVMRAQSSPAIKVQQTFATKKMTEPKPGVRVYDMGQNASAWPRIEVRGDAGAVVKMTPGELLDANGMVSQRSSGGPNTFSYTLGGAGKQAWEPRFTYYGYRYLQVETTGHVEIDKVESRFVHLDAAQVGAFECSNERFNQIHALINAAILSNLQHSLTDCPHREKLGWLEQAHLMGAAVMYNRDMRTFWPKMLADVREAQLTNGLIPDIAPEYVVFGRGFRDSPEWGSAGVLVPDLAWRWYGDRATLAASYTSIKNYADYLDSKLEKGLLGYGLGDWYDIGPRGPGVSQLTPLGVTASSIYYADLDVLARAARLLGKPGDQVRADLRALKLRTAFNRTYFKASEKSYATGSQTSLSMPLALYLVPKEARAAVLDKLVADIRAKGNHTTAGDIGYHYVLEALRNGGRGDVIFDMANSDTPPSYAAQLKGGATSLTEAWDTNPSSSQNHLMLGHIEEWFYAGLAGIRPDDMSPGLKHIFITPQAVGDLKWVKAAWETPRGPVKVDWKKDGTALEVNIELPPGMTATVKLPGSPAREIGSGRSELRAGK